MHWLDGPAAQIYMLSSANNARWGFKSEQILALGGASADTAHLSAKYLHCFNNGSGNNSEGGNIYLQGSEHAQIYYKSFGSYGDGLRLNAFACDITGSTELDGAINTAITTWTSGQVITAEEVAAGLVWRYQQNCYLATTSGKTGSTPPTWTSGTQSDGGVSWEFRSGQGLVSMGNAKNQNRTTLIFGNGFHTVPSTDVLFTGDSYDGQSSRPQASILGSRVHSISRQVLFGDYNYGSNVAADYGTLDLVATVGGIATLGAITAGGSSYANGTYSVALTGGSGTAATANITVSGGTVMAVTLVGARQSYLVGDVLSATGGTGFSVPVASLVTEAGQYDLAHNTTGAGAPIDLFLGRNGSLSPYENLRLRGDGHAAISDIPVGGRVYPSTITSNFSTAVQGVGVADLYFVDCTSGAITFNIGPPLGALPGARVTVVKVDSSANALTITGGGTYNGTGFGSYNIGRPWAYTELVLRDTSPAWWRKT